MSIQTISVFERLYSSNTEIEEKESRKHAVACALELIKADLLSSNERSDHLKYHMENLSDYADKIESALKN
ncbi:hypothetical protein SBX64_15915 [Vibrio rhizosphaerae]|uniref:Uncharacterized protein n=1 Tax=Vibrio rhizosphaerae TaxID=398736 RepID=A0ABU4IXA3_9VIBR|nr:hypothetical protein [Vibrio rhizosphaerae]MDW6094025.1 hypothetical protein [Vibrio rhizosphaerae]